MRRKVVLALAATVAATCTLTATMTIVASGSDAVTQFQLPQGDAMATAIATGPDGAVWILDGSGRILGAHPYSGDQPRARFEQVELPDPHSFPTGLTVGPDGALWFTEQFGNRIGRVDPSAPSRQRTVLEYPVPTPASEPTGITTGPDGALWFTEQAGNRIGRIATDGTVTEFALPRPDSHPTGITSGPDGALWFTEQFGNRIGRISIDGTGISEVRLPTEASFPTSIVLGADHTLWFTERDQHQIGRVTLAAKPAITEFALPTDSGAPRAIAPSCDGRVWFAQQGGKVGALGDTSPGSCLPTLPQVEATGNPLSVLGPSQMTAPQLADWYRSTRHTAHLSGSTTIDDLAALYIDEGNTAGVRGDLAFAQSVLETGYFAFHSGGQVGAADNNFAGLGACDSCSSGRRFATPRDGVRAQIQHLRNYADPASTTTNLGAPPSPGWYGSDPATATHNFDTFFAKGHAPTWLQMGNGNWATDPSYSSKIVAIYARMLRSTNGT